MVVLKDGFFEGFESENGDLFFGKTFFDVETNSFGDSLDGSFSALVVIEARSVAANHFGESDGFETERGIGGFGDFTGVAAVFVEDKAAVGFFEPFDCVDVPTMDELVFVVEDVEVSAGGLHDAS